MEIMEWKEEFAFGLPDIDDEHKSLFGAINRIIENANSDNPGKEIEINVSIDFLIQYVNEHFKNEEEMFDQTDYPKKDMHKKIHHDLKKKVMTFKEKFNSGDYESLNEFLPIAKFWLTNHILVEDRAYVDYCVLKNVGVVSRTAV